MASFQRPHVEELIGLLRDDDLPPRIVAMTGPRQSGKTTIVRQALRRLRASGFPVMLVAVDDPHAPQDLHDWRSSLRSEATVVPDPRLRNVAWLTRVWEVARERAWQSERGFVLALDEIHEIRDWSRAVKGLWDRDRHTGCPLKVVILGSAPWELLTGRGESLAGRFLPLDVGHWSLTEMVRAFDFTLANFERLNRSRKQARSGLSAIQSGKWRTKALLTPVERNIRDASGAESGRWVRIGRPILGQFGPIPAYSGLVWPVPVYSRPIPGQSPGRDTGRQAG